jgi:hypothetical protein
VRFGNSPSDGKSPFTGRITHANVRFTRTILPDNQTQSWAARWSVQSGVARLIDGHWSGYMFPPGIGDFEAERIKAAAPDPEPVAGSSIVGRWRWVCCGGGHSGIFTVKQQDAQWRAQVVDSGSSLRTTGGEWSGYAAGPGNADFQATFTGSR